MRYFENIIEKEIEYHINDSEASINIFLDPIFNNIRYCVGWDCAFDVYEQEPTTVTIVRSAVLNQLSNNRLFLQKLASEED